VTQGATGRSRHGNQGRTVGDPSSTNAPKGDPRAQRRPLDPPTAGTADVRRRSPWDGTGDEPEHPAPSVMDVAAADDAETGDPGTDGSTAPSATTATVTTTVTTRAARPRP